MNPCPNCDPNARAMELARGALSCTCSKLLKDGTHLTCCPQCDAEDVADAILAYGRERWDAALDNFEVTSARITQDECSCGGSGYDDPLACPACRCWHRLAAAIRALKQ